MIKILISDTHFGVRQNSITWLKSQSEFIVKQLIPKLKELKNNHPNEKLRLIHLGDVFDSRSSINTMVASKVVELFTELKNIVDEFIIISGNHDFYSPDETHATINTNELIFNHLVDNKFILVTNNILYKENDAYIPWYKWLNQEELVKELADKNIQYIFTHADLVNEPVLVNGPVIFSGHIHTPITQGNHYTIGSIYPLTFTDCNSFRYFYLLEDFKLTKIPNKTSINFWRLYNQEIFDKEKIDLLNNLDYVELYINQDNLVKEDYLKQIKEITSKLHNISIIPQSTQLVGESITDFDNYNIEKVCYDNIPDELKSKFNKILSKINESN